MKALKVENPKININMNLIIQATEKLVIKKEILKHKNKGLKEALMKEKKRRKKGKTMKLFF